MVTQNIASWNQMQRWLKCVDSLRALRDQVDGLRAEGSDGWSVGWGG